VHLRLPRSFSSGPAYEARSAAAACSAADGDLSSLLRQEYELLGSERRGENDRRDPRFSARNGSADAYACGGDLSRTDARDQALTNLADAMNALVRADATPLLFTRERG